MRAIKLYWGVGVAIQFHALITDRSWWVIRLTPQPV